MTDSIVTPENTKKIAAWMGKKAVVFEDMVIISNPAGQIYNPITNAEQSREIEKRLISKYYYIIEGGEIVGDKGQYYEIKTEDGEIIAKAETLELAIYKAALLVAEK